jgi:hypothetical protein
MGFPHLLTVHCVVGESWHEHVIRTDNDPLLRGTNFAHLAGTSAASNDFTSTCRRINDQSIAAWRFLQGSLTRLENRESLECLNGFFSMASENQPQGTNNTWEIDISCKEVRHFWNAEEPLICRRKGKNERLCSSYMVFRA